MRILIPLSKKPIASSSLSIKLPGNVHSTSQCKIGESIEIYLGLNWV
jgi:hypothetical protein